MFTKLIAVSFATLLLVPAALAEDHEVKMLNKGVEAVMVFEPAFVKAVVGDTVTFITVDEGHNVENIKDMLPAGVEQFKSKIGKDYVLTLTAEGLYGVKCTPHYVMGMVALIQAGAPLNKKAVVSAKLLGKAKPRFEPLAAQIAD